MKIVSTSLRVSRQKVHVQDRSPMWSVQAGVIQLSVEDGERLWSAVLSESEARSLLSFLREQIEGAPKTGATVLIGATGVDWEAFEREVERVIEKIASDTIALMRENDERVNATTFARACVDLVPDRMSDDLWPVRESAEAEKRIRRIARERFT